MAELDPLLAVAMLGRSMPAGQGDEFLGSCFAFRDSSSFVTAQHCVKVVPLEKLYVQLPHHGDSLFPAVNVVVHPNADLAIVRVGRENLPPFEPFRNVSEAWSMGADFVGYGFPEDVFGDEPMPTRA